MHLPFAGNLLSSFFTGEDDDDFDEEAEVVGVGSSGQPSQVELD